MTGSEALDILSGSNPASVIVGRIVGKKKHIEALQAIKQDLEKLEKLEKVVEIIKERSLLGFLEICPNYEFYSGYAQRVTEDEFYFLKEMLKNE